MQAGLKGLQSQINPIHTHTTYGFKTRLIFYAQVRSMIVKYATMSSANSYNILM
jgi:hypothetical protein